MSLNHDGSVVLLVGGGVILMFLLGGCYMPGSWEVIEQEAPWCGPHTEAVTKRRWLWPPPMVAAPERPETAWEVNGQIIKQASVARSISDHLSSIGFIERQETTQSRRGDVYERVAPFRFFIVSIKPTVVVMTDHNYGQVTGKAISELASNLHSRYLYSFPLANGYHYGRSVPAERRYLWFSPDLETDIQPVMSANGQFRIDHDAVIVTFGGVAIDGFYTVVRQR